MRPKNPPIKHPKEVVNRARTFRALGYNPREIGDILGISEWTIRGWFKNLNRAKA